MTDTRKLALKVEKSFDYSVGAKEWVPYIKVMFPPVPNDGHDSPIWKARDELAEQIARGALEAAPAVPSAPQGWVMVPVQPTDRMMDCFCGTDYNLLSPGKRSNEQKAYADMLAAAPSVKVKAPSVGLPPSFPPIPEPDFDGTPNCGYDDSSYNDEQWHEYARSYALRAIAEDRVHRASQVEAQAPVEQAEALLEGLAKNPRWQLDNDIQKFGLPGKWRVWKLIGSQYRSTEVKVLGEGSTPAEAIRAALATQEKKNG